MPKSDVVYTQLATRVPATLAKALKLYSVQNEIPIMQIVTTAIAKAIGHKEKGA